MQPARDAPAATPVRSTDHAGADQVGTDPAGTDQTGTDQTGTDQTGTDQAGTDPAGVRRELAALLPDLRAFARFLVRDATQADDLVQDGVVRALAALHQFEPGTNLKAWLFTILRNHFYEQVRRRKRERRALEAGFAMEEAHPPPQVRREEMVDLGRLLWQLPPLLREALVLVGAQELSHDQAAVICGVPVGTMKARVSRARSQLVALAGNPKE